MKLIPFVVVLTLTGCPLWTSLDSVTLASDSDALGPDLEMGVIEPDQDASLELDLGADLPTEPAFTELDTIDVTMVVRDPTNLDTGDVGIRQFLEIGLNARVEYRDDDSDVPLDTDPGIIILTDTIDQLNAVKYRDIGKPMIILDAGAAEELALHDGSMLTNDCQNGQAERDEVLEEFAPEGPIELLDTGGLSCRAFSLDPGAINLVTLGPASVMYRLEQGSTINGRTIGASMIVMGFANDRFANFTPYAWNLLAGAVWFSAGGGSFPSNGKKLLLVDSNEVMTRGAFWSVATAGLAMRARVAGFEFTQLDPKVVTQGDGFLHDVILVPESGSAMNVALTMNNTTAGIVTSSFQFSFLNALRLVYNGVASTPPERAWFMIDNPFQETRGAFPILDRPASMTALDGPTNGAQVIAHIPGNVDGVFSIYIDRGGELSDAEPAPGRRVFMGLGDGTRDLSYQGVDLLDRLLWWSAN